MHEPSIAHEVVDLAGEHLLRAGGTRALTVRLRVGALAGAVPSALRSAFGAASIGSPVDGAKLVIDEVPAAIFCAACGFERTLTAVGSRRCPECQTPARDVSRGAELELVAIELA